MKTGECMDVGKTKSWTVEDNGGVVVSPGNILLFFLDNRAFGLFGSDRGKETLHLILGINTVGIC